MNIYGASGHAKVIIDIIHSRMEQIHHIIDDNTAITGIYSYPVVHELTPEIMRKKTIIAIGNNETRKRIAEKLQTSAAKPIHHASAVVDATVEMGNGSVVMANATINADTIIGQHCIVNTASTIEHDCVIANFVHISPNAVLAGGVVVGEGAQIGIGAMVIPGIRIGKWSTVGAGAVVIEDVPDYATVVGNPGRVIKFREQI